MTIISKSHCFQANESRVVMSWNPEPRDLDLHVLQIDRTSGGIFCHCYYGNKYCPGLNLDVDNTQVTEKAPFSLYLLLAGIHVSPLTDMLNKFLLSLYHGALVNTVLHSNEGK